MSRRVGALTSDEISAQLAEDTPDSDECEAVVDDSEDEEDNVYVFREADDDGGNDQANDEEAEGDEVQGTTQHIRAGQLTMSQKKLDEADLHLVPPQDAGPYVVRGAKGAVTTWETTPPPPNRRCSLANVLREVAGVNGRKAKAAKDGVSALRLFLTDKMVAEILRRTNEKLQRERSRQRTEYAGDAANKTAHRVADLSETEFWGFIGLCILRGFYPVPLSDLFDPARGPAVFAATMACSRFQSILRHSVPELGNLGGNQHPTAINFPLIFKTLKVIFHSFFTLA